MKITHVCLVADDTLSCGGNNNFDVITAIMHEYPKYKERIEKIVKEYDDYDNFKEEVRKKGFRTFCKRRQYVCSF